MSKSKHLAIIPSTSGPSPQMAAQLHECVLSAGAISAASAILCGLQLAADRDALAAIRKESASTCTFDEWLDENKEWLGFSRRTAFNYIKAAAETKAKLLKKRDPKLLNLLNSAPQSLTKHGRTMLMEEVQKCIGVKTLMDIYIEGKVVRDQHQTPDSSSSSTNTSSDEGSTRKKKTRSDEVIIQEQLLLPLENLQKGISATFKLGEARIERWAKLPKAEFDKIDKGLALAEENIGELRRKLAEARKK